MTDRACIVGIGETRYARDKAWSPTTLGLHLEAAVRAIEDAGLRIRDIDGVMPFPNLSSAEEIATNLGLEELAFASTVHMGGASPVASLLHNTPLTPVPCRSTSRRLSMSVTGGVPGMTIGASLHALPL